MSKIRLKEYILKDSIGYMEKRIVAYADVTNHIKDMIKNLDDEEVKKDLEEIVKTTNKILDTIDKNNLNNRTTNKFIEYYLPICVKIVDRYDEIENQKLTSIDSKKFMADSKKIIKDTNKAFKKILNSLYQSDILNADAEMKVYNSILKSDGYDDEIMDLKEGDSDE